MPQMLVIDPHLLQNCLHASLRTGEIIRDLSLRVQDTVHIANQTRQDFAGFVREMATVTQNQEIENSNLRLHIDRTLRVNETMPRPQAPGSNVNNKEIKKDTFPSLDFSEESKKTLKDWCEWKRGVELVFIANPWLRQRNIDELVAAIIRDLGKGRKYTQTTIQADETTHSFGFQTLDGFYDKLKTLVCGSAVQTKAEAAFRTFDPRATKRKMEFTMLHIELKTMWLCGYPEGQRSYQVLITKLLTIIDETMLEELISRVLPFKHPETRMVPYTAEGYDLLREYGEEILADRELVKSYRKGDPLANKTGGQQKGGHQGGGQRQAHEPMDTSIVLHPKGGQGGKNNKNPPGGQNPKRQGQQGQQSQNKGQQGQNKPGAGANPSGPNGLSQDEIQERMKNGTCFKCNQVGHISRNCPKKKPQGQGGRRVNNVEIPDATEETGESVREYSDGNDESGYESANAYSGAAITNAIAGYNAWHNVPTVPRHPAMGNTTGRSLGPQGSGHRC